MFKTLIGKAITFFSSLFLLGGLALGGMYFYTKHQAESGGGIPAQNTLSAISGKVVEGREVTLETKRRRGINSKEMFYELDVQPENGKLLQLRLDHSIPKERLEIVLGEHITAQYDADEDNQTYDIAMNGTAVVTYQEIARLAQDRADKQADFFAKPEMLQSGITWIVMGAIGLLFSRLLRRKKAPAPHNPPTDSQS